MALAMAGGCRLSAKLRLSVTRQDGELSLITGRPLAPTLTTYTTTITRGLSCRPTAMSLPTTLLLDSVPVASAVLFSNLVI